MVKYFFTLSQPVHDPSADLFLEAFHRTAPQLRYFLSCVRANYAHDRPERQTPRKPADTRFSRGLLRAVFIPCFFCSFVDLIDNFSFVIVINVVNGNFHDFVDPLFIGFAPMSPP